MNPAGPRAPCRASGAAVPFGARGFSLLEVLLVVAIIAIASVLAAAAIRGSSPGIQLRAQAKEIAAQLRYTRAHAIATGQASTGGRVRLRIRSAAWNVDVAWLTGQVRAVRAPVVP